MDYYYITPLYLVIDNMKINNKLLNIPNINTQKITNNEASFTIRISHRGGSNINSAIIFCNQCCYVVAVGNSDQIWTYELGRYGNTTMTASIANHTDFYVDVNLTFTSTIYGGISVICLD